MTITIDPERLAQLDQIQLDHGAHDDFANGHCAMEVVAWLADQGHTDAPACASPVLARYTIRLNDRWGHDQRQTLKPYLPRMIGTGGDGKDVLREQIARRFLATRLLGPWLRLAALDDHADALEAASPSDLRRLLNEAYNAAWTARRKNVDLLAEKVREHLRAQGKPDVAAAAAVAAAVADADADAVAVADAAAAAAAAADVVADVVAAVAAAGAAVAVAVAAAVAAPYVDKWSAAYSAARDYYRQHPLPVSQQIADLAAEQQGLALELLDQLIDPQDI